MFEGFPDGPGEEDHDNERPMSWWEVLYMLGGMAMVAYAIYGLIANTK